MAKNNPSITGTTVKVLLLLFALIGVIWAMSRLRAGALNPVANELIGQGSELAPERKAQVKFSATTESPSAEGDAPASENQNSPAQQ